MSIEQLDVVDIVSTDPNGKVKLTVSDHLDWSNIDAHLTLLQAKLNKYLAFAEGGEVYETYPTAKDHLIGLHVCFREKPPRKAEQFLSKAGEIIKQAGFGFTHEVFSLSYNN